MRFIVDNLALLFYTYYRIMVILKGEQYGSKNACTKCGCINTIDIHSLLRKDITDKDGNHYLVLYFKCEQCKTINVVQIDNNETRQLYRTFKSLLIKVMKKRVKHETISPKDVKKKTNTRRRSLRCVKN